MTVSSTANRVSYSANGVTTSFSFPYYFLLQSDLIVTGIDNLGNVTTYVLNTDYTVAGTPAANGTYPNGGSVVFGTAPAVVGPATSFTIGIVRKPADTQTTHWVDGDPDPSAVKETAFDKLTLLMQRAMDLLGRTPTLPDAVTATFSNQLPTVMTPNLGLAVNSAGTGWTLIATAGATSGTVTSVGLQMPADFSVGSTPVTSSGTITVTWATQNANKILAGPTSGGAASPTWRSLVVSDIPSGILASTLSSGAATSGYVLTANGSGASSWQSVAGTGTVTSVGLSVPSFLSVAGSPVTSSGTLAVTLASQTANLIFASPSGSSGTPTFRPLVVADIPAGVLASGLSSGSATSGYVLAANGSGASAWVAPVGLTSVGLTMPASTFGVASTPLTSNGTIAVSLSSQNANLVFAGPASGIAAAPTWRSLVNADLPVMVGASSIASGVSGAVPSPSAGENGLFLRGDAQWATPSVGVAVGPELISNISANTTLGSVQQVGLISGNTGPVTVTLPTLASMIATVGANNYSTPVVLINDSAFPVTVAAAAGDQVENGASVQLTLQGTSYTLYPTSNGWFIA